MTVRTRAALLALFPDNTSGDAEPVDVRDVIDSLGMLLPGPTPTYRSSSQTQNASASFTAAIPAGSVAGDTLIAYCAGGNPFTMPTAASTGFVLHHVEHALAGMGCLIFSKVLQAAEIAAGTITINTLAFGSVIGLVTYIGSAFKIVNIDMVHLPTQMLNTVQTPAQWQMKQPLQAGDELVIAMSTRAGAVLTSDVGTSLQAVNGGLSLGLYRYTVPASGLFTSGANFTATGFEQIFARIVLRGT